MIQSLPCPGCHRTLVLAAEASLQAVLRCRHCSHQFVLGEMIEAELGFWEVVDDPNAAELNDTGLNDTELNVARLNVAERAASQSHVTGEADDAELELAAPDEYISPQVLLKKQSETKNGDSSKFEPLTHGQYERVRRKSKSPIWSTLSVLLGGLASIPIATLLIWHVLGKDPLQMGPVVGRYIPWVVPARFQPHASDFSESNRPAAPPTGASGFRRFDDIMDTSPTASESPAVGESSEMKSVPRPKSFSIRGTGPRRAITAPADVATDVLPDNEATEASPAAAEGLSDNVFARIGQVKKNLEAWNERDENHELNKKLAFQTYSNLSSLALAIDKLPVGSPLRRLVRSEMFAVSQQIAQHTDIQQLIQSGSRFWLTTHQDEQVGLAIVIVVASASEVDDAWQITPATAVGEEDMQIRVPLEIIPSLSPGQNILVIGSLARMKSDANAEPAEAPAKPASMFTANYVHVLEPE